MKNNELSSMIKRRNDLDDKIRDEKLKLYENFTLEFLSIFGKTVDDIPSTKKACKEFIENLIGKKEEIVEN